MDWLLAAARARIGENPSIMLAKRPKVEARAEIAHLQPNAVQKHL